jgi:hypothetical protein
MQFDASPGCRGVVGLEQQVQGKVYHIAVGVPLPLEYFAMYGDPAFHVVGFMGLRVYGFMGLRVVDLLIC